MALISFPRSADTQGASITRKHSVRAATVLVVRPAVIDKSPDWLARRLDVVNARSSLLPEGIESHQPITFVLEGVGKRG
jgi:hypothetical protein